MYENMTWDELEARREELIVQRTTINSELKELMEIRNAMEAQHDAENLVAGMNDAQKEAMRQIISPSGVGSTNAFGNVG